MRSTATAIAVVLLTILGAATAHAHGEPDTEEYEEWLVGDFGTDLTLHAPTGYEIDNIVYREAHLPEHGGAGLAIFLDAYGGAAFFGGEAWFLYEFDTPGGTITRSVSTSDDRTVSGDGVVLQADFEPAGLPGHAAIAEITMFFPLEDLGLTRGEELSTMRFATAYDYGAGPWRFDVVPGGTALVPAPAPADEPVIPEGGDTSPIESRIVQGGAQHLDVVLDGEGLVVTNALQQTPQVVTVHIDGAPAATRTLPPAGEVTVPLPAGTTGVVEAISDIGGYGVVALDT